MLAPSTRDRSRSPHQSSTGANGNTSISTECDRSSQSETNGHSQNKSKKDNDSQHRLRSLKSFIQTLINDSTSSLGSMTDEQIKAIENACVEEYRDLSLERIRRMIRSLLKTSKSHPSSSPSSSSANSHRTPSLMSQDHKNVVSNSIESSNRKSNRSSNSSSTSKSTDLLTPSVSTLSALDSDFLRHAFSQQFCPSLDLAAYFPSTTSTTNGSGPASPLFRPNFSPSSFLQSLTNTTPLAPPPPPPPPLVSSHTNTNGTNEGSTININKSSKSLKLSSVETNSIRVLVNAYREAASYLCRSADELEQLT